MSGGLPRTLRWWRCFGTTSMLLGRWETQLWPKFRLWGIPRQKHWSELRIFSRKFWREELHLRVSMLRMTFTSAEVMMTVRH